MQLSAIHVYPVKSLRGVSLPRGEARRAGFRHDRRWMLTDEDGRFITQREDVRLSQVDVALNGNGYVLSVDKRLIELPEEFAGERTRVTVWRSTLDAALHPEGSAWFSDWLDRKVQLVFLPRDVVRSTNQGEEGDQVSFADGYPYLLVGQSSLADLNNRISADEPLSMARFRPNLVVSGADAYAEDGWQRLQIGALRFRGIKRCDRCTITTINPETAQKGPEPLRTLSKYRREGNNVYFGMNLCPDAEGELQVGDELLPLR